MQLCRQAEGFVPADIELDSAAAYALEGLEYALTTYATSMAMITLTDTPATESGTKRAVMRSTGSSS